MNFGFRLSHVAALAFLVIAPTAYALSNGDRIRVASSNGVSVRRSPGGTSYAAGQPRDATGTIISNSISAPINGSGRNYTWWDINFDSGQDGWVASDDGAIVVASDPVPTITSVSPDPVPGSTSAQPFTINGTNFTASKWVIESVRDPIPFFRALTTLLSDGGVLYFEGRSIAPYVAGFYERHAGTDTVPVVRDAEALVLSSEERALPADRLVESLDAAEAGRIDRLWAGQPKPDGAAMRRAVDRCRPFRAVRRWHACGARSVDEV